MERIRRELSLAKDQVASFISWSQVELAVEHIEGQTYINTGRPDSSTQVHIRLDKDTMAEAMKYLEQNKPRLLYISLNDADDWGHKYQYPKYLETLRSYDQWIYDIVKKLETLGEYGRNTTLIVTTDHGRGTGILWGGHGWVIPDSKYVWLYARSPQTINRGRMLKNRIYTHADIRPTIEEALGLEPQLCPTCGFSIRALFKVADHN
jgi:arylsulfatase A-like enzyme